MEKTLAAYALRLHGEAVELAPGHFWAELRSDGCEVLGELEPDLAGEATCRRELRVGDDGRFSAVGELGFAGKTTLTFRTEGRFTAADHARRGTSLGTITGAGRLAGTTGYVASSFLLWASGDLSEDHLGVLFVGRPLTAAGKETQS